MSSRNTPSRPALLTPSLRSPSAALVPSLLPSGSSASLTRRQRGVLEEGRTQRLVIDATRGKAQHAHEALRTIHEHAEATFAEATGAILAIKNQPGRTREHQAIVEDFTGRNVQLLSNHLHGVIAVSARNVAEIVDLSLYPPPEPPPGLFKKLLGGA